METFLQQVSYFHALVHQLHCTSIAWHTNAEVLHVADLEWTCRFNSRRDPSLSRASVICRVCGPKHCVRSCRGDLPRRSNQDRGNVDVFCLPSQGRWKASTANQMRRPGTNPSWWLDAMSSTVTCLFAVMAGQDSVLASVKDQKKLPWCRQGPRRRCHALRESLPAFSFFSKAAPMLLEWNKMVVAAIIISTCSRPRSFSPHRRAAPSVKGSRGGF